MITLLCVALMAVAAIAYKAIFEWGFHRQWYENNDKWWESVYNNTLVATKQWHELYAKSLAAAQDLDKQVSDYRYVIAENNIKIAMLEKQVSDCHEIIDDLDAEVAMLNINITEMFMEHQSLQRERNGYYKELASLKSNHTLTPICHKCKRRMKKDSVLVDGVYTCDWCKGKEKKAETAKHLLADAKVGDLCQRRDGKWVQIELIDPSKERSYMAGDSWYFPNGREYSNREYERDIVHVKQKCKDQFRDATKMVESDDKPLLSDAKVGDKVGLRNGDIDTIISLENKSKLYGKTHPIVTMHLLTGYTVDGRYHNEFTDHPYDIVELIKENDIDLSNLPCYHEQPKQDLTDAPFEGLTGVKEGDPILFSDGKIRNVRKIDAFSYVYIVPFIEPNCTGFKFIDGKHCFNKTPIRAIRIATPIDLKLYGGGE